MNLHIIKAIMRKQCRDTIKNKSILIQFMMFPVISIILTSSISVTEIPKEYFVILFATMYVGMAPIIVISNIIGEEKETGSLRMLMMSNVKPMEYILGVSIFVMAACILGLIVMGFAAGYEGIKLLWFVVICASGMLVSILLGSIIGLCSRNQMTANSLSVPAMLICSFIPMLSMFNQTIKDFGQFLYTQQINELLTALSTEAVSDKGWWIILCNFIVFLFLYIWKFGKRNLLS